MIRRVISCILVLGLAACTTSAPTGDVVTSTNDNDSVKVVEMTAQQFAFQPTVVRVEQGRRLRLAITSTDVAHGFSLPAFDIDKRLPPGKTVTVEFTPDKTGTFTFKCSVYCGSGHESMTGRLVVR